MDFLTQWVYETRTCMPCAPHSLVSACALLLCAAIAQAVQGYPDSTSVSFLLLGVSSVIHHWRLDEWWKQDVWRWLDYLAIVAFFALGSCRFRDSAHWWAMCAGVLAIAAVIWCGCVPRDKVPCVHAAIHCTVAATALAAIGHASSRA